MSTALEIIKSLTVIGQGSTIHYVPYDIQLVQIYYGAPPVPVHGFSYVWARHDAPQRGMTKCLTGNAVFLQNLNTSGTVEIGLMNSSVSAASIALLDAVGIPHPIVVTDASTVGGGFAAAKCIRVGTPEWRRARLPGMEIFTFSCESLVINIGPRKAQ